MKQNLLWILAATCMCSGPLTGMSQDKEPHPHGRNIYKPQIIMFFAKDIELTDEQRKFVLSETESMEQALTREKDRFRKETAKFHRLLEKRITGESEAREQAARMLDAERATKAGELRLLVRLKNQLTGKQNVRLRDLTLSFDQRKLYPDPAAQKRLRAKMDKISEGMREMVDLGVSPAKIQALTKRAQLFFRVGLFADGEKSMDEALGKLNDPF